MRDLDTLLTSEMTAEEWKEYRRRWIKEYAKELVIECGTKPHEAAMIADIRFEDFVGQEGFTWRNEKIANERVLL